TCVLLTAQARSSFGTWRLAKNRTDCSREPAVGGHRGRWLSPLSASCILRCQERSHLHPARHRARRGVAHGTIAMADPTIPLPCRRAFSGQSAPGRAARATLFHEEGRAAEGEGLPGLPHSPPKAKRVIYLFQSGAPSQMDLFDHKPKLKELRGEELPE